MSGGSASKGQAGAGRGWLEGRRRGPSEPDHPLFQHSPPDVEAAGEKGVDIGLAEQAGVAG